MVDVYEYTNGSWQNSYYGMYKKAGDTLTDEDLRDIAEFYTYEFVGIAGFISEPVTDPSEITGFISGGMTVDKDMIIYIVKASLEYTKENGDTGTLYWLGDGNDLIDRLVQLQTAGCEWHFDSADGELADQQAFDSRYYVEQPSASPYEAARFKAVEVRTN